MDTLIHYSQWLGGLGKKVETNDEQCGCKENGS